MVLLSVDLAGRGLVLTPATDVQEMLTRGSASDRQALEAANPMLDRLLR